MGWVVVLSVAVAVGWAGTRLVRAVAPRVGLLDHPDGRRKLQPRAVPVGGGLAVFAAATAAAVAGVLFVDEVGAAFRADPAPGLWLLAAAALITAVGLLDDLYDLRARYKLLGQVAAVALVVGPGGMVVHTFTVLGWQAQLPAWLAYVATGFWCLAAVNALNLLDGMDGLLGTVGVIACGAVAAMAGVNGYPMAGVIALGMAGALAGFLRYNLPPATIYLGDCGSMLVGLVVAAVSIQASVKSHAAAVIAPAALLVLPFLDTAAAIVRRQLSGRGWATADRDHLHHVLLRGGLTVRRVLMLVAVLGTVAAVGVLAGTHFRNDLISLITAGGVVLMLVASGLFGAEELKLLRSRAGAALAAARGQSPTVVEVRVAPRPEWDVVWDALASAADRLHLRAVTLDTCDGREPVRRAWANGETGSGDTWRAELALRDPGRRPAARVMASGAWDSEPLAAKLAALAHAIESASGAAALTPLPARMGV